MTTRTYTYSYEIESDTGPEQVEFRVTDNSPVIDIQISDYHLRKLERDRPPSETGLYARSQLRIHIGECHWFDDPRPYAPLPHANIMQTVMYSLRAMRRFLWYARKTHWTLEFVGSSRVRVVLKQYDVPPYVYIACTEPMHLAHPDTAKRLEENRSYNEDVKSVTRWYAAPGIENMRIIYYDQTQIARYITSDSPLLTSQPMDGQRYLIDYPEDAPWVEKFWGRDEFSAEQVVYTSTVYADLAAVIRREMQELYERMTPEHLDPYEEVDPFVNT